MRIHASDVAPAHGQRAGIGRQRAGQQVDQRRLAGTRQAHDDVDAALFNRQADVAQAQRVAAFGQQLFLAHAVLGGLQPFLRMRTEDLVDVLDLDLAHRWPPMRMRCPYDCVIRSNSTASTTIPKPASRPRPTSRRLIPSNTS
ncbi:hypothetical protein G6F31_016368 [Rhizopus arrhizus]|nr:hypothetical protein G6F31_016368 [Rhizopus arrhizus]